MSLAESGDSSEEGPALTFESLGTTVGSVDSANENMIGRWQSVRELGN